MTGSIANVGTGCAAEGCTPGATWDTTGIALNGASWLPAAPLLHRGDRRSGELPPVGAPSAGPHPDLHLMRIVLRQRSSRLAGVVLAAAVSLGGVTGAQAATSMPAGAPSLGVRALDGSAGQDALEAEVLRLTNKARSHSRKCGGKRMKSAKPLRWSDQLAASAHEHSADMATQDYFSHYSPSGASPFARIRATGYSYSAAGENIAAGLPLADPAAVVKAWLKSPGHCRVLMDRTYKELGVGRVEGAGTWGVYWTQNFGRRG